MIILCFGLLGKNKQIMSDTNKMQLTILQDLSSWCLEDLQSRMNRIKVETLVTIQVYSVWWCGIVVGGYDGVVWVEMVYRMGRGEDEGGGEW